MESFGRLLLSDGEGRDIEFELASKRLTIGRGSNNDLQVTEPNASRNHARIDAGPGGVYLTDLGSANGTFVNDAQIRKIQLKAGDVIRIGNSFFHFEAPLEQDPTRVTLINSSADLENTLIHDTVSMAINDTSQPRLVVHTGDLTWEVPLTGDSYLIGRGEHTDIHIPNARISREHARVFRHNKQWVIEDLGSGNGTWLRSNSVERRVLENGDVLRIGTTRLIFKQPFSVEELVQPAFPEPAPGKRKPVVVVPGLLGSKLGKGAEILWPNHRVMFTHPEIYRLPEDEPLEAIEIMDELAVLPNLIKLEKYNRLGDFLVEGLGYTRGVDLIEFAYDWRKDVRAAAHQLGQVIEEWENKGPITLIGHSLGTLVSRYFVERLGGKKKVDRLILLGGPHRGVPRAVTSLMEGARLLPFGLLGDRIRGILTTFPSMYQIVPDYACVRDRAGESINLLEDDTWLEEEKRPLLRNAREFRKELGYTSSVPALSIFGYGNNTMMDIIVDRDSNGAWQNIRLESAAQGDDTIPEFSAILPGTDIHPVEQFHGSLYVDNDVRMRLKVELTRPYSKF